MDVKVLYANMPNNKGVADVKQKRNNYTKKTVATKKDSNIFTTYFETKQFIFN